MTENIWQEALRRTRRGPLGQLAGIFGATDLDDAFWAGLEASLIQADVGVETTLELLEELKELSSSQGWHQTEQARQGLRRALADRLTAENEIKPTEFPHVILLVGVNGSGKTTTAARLAHRWQQRGFSIVLAAADTYRAAAAEQLASWADRLGIECVQGPANSDPGAVVYQACQRAASKNFEVLIADTSGRMHTHHNLMEELKKIHRVAGKANEGSPQETLLVLDATTGQNGLIQAQSFLQAIPVTGVVLAKLDHSARGGVAIAVSSELGLPIRYVGLGEDMDDLKPFNPDSYIDGLLPAV